MIPGGWILTPANNTLIDPPTKGRIAIISLPAPFSWVNLPEVPLPPMVLAESYFRQAGIKTFFSKFVVTGGGFNHEVSFRLPAKRNYTTPYALNFYKTALMIFCL